MAGQRNRKTHLNCVQWRQERRDSQFAIVRGRFNEKRNRRLGLGICRRMPGRFVGLNWEVKELGEKKRREVASKKGGNLGHGILATRDSINDV